MADRRCLRCRVPRLVRGSSANLFNVAVYRHSAATGPLRGAEFLEEIGALLLHHSIANPIKEHLDGVRDATPQSLAHVLADLGRETNLIAFGKNSETCNRGDPPSRVSMHKTQEYWRAR